MLAFLTGVPGFGKTAHAIDWLYFQDSDYSGLEKYVEGVSGLNNVKCPHFLFPTLREVKAADYVPISVVDASDDDADDLTFDPEEADKYKPWLPSHPEYAQFLVERAEAKSSIELWYLWVTPSSVIVIDEAQRFYRPRPNGAKVPLHIKMLEYHRHFGCHFILISQAPRLMDIHFRALVEKHVHLDKTWKGGLKYEWIGCRTIEGGIVSATDKKDAAKSSYRPPKHVFPLYKSSSVHLKTSHKIPTAIWLMLAAIPVFIGLVWFLFHKIKTDHHLGAPSVISEASAAPVFASSVPAGFSMAPASAVSGGPAVVPSLIADFTPSVVGRPETAPAFNELRKVVVMPVISACIQSAHDCKCYTQQGSQIYDMDAAACGSYLSKGRHFNPYSQPVQTAAYVPASAFARDGDARGSSVESRLSMEPVRASFLPDMTDARPPVESTYYKK
jgi:zona occludens toxin